MLVPFKHFSINKSPQARLDRIWKIRPVVDVLQRTFSRGYKPPSVISFDEATLPSRSRFNHTRQFNKDKPVPQDNNCGDAAVLRNMNALLPPSDKSPWRLVITDRFYTSVKLALELLHRRMYITGTIGVDRSGYALGVVASKKYKTVNKQKVMVPPQGTVKLAQYKKFPKITAAIWMDRIPVHMLSSGRSRRLVTVGKSTACSLLYHFILIQSLIVL
ncbi:hypothetical protein PHMEG_00029153 [Phytophthora megakarya]|uniref:Uncharacterized protein n=1 Tax=Phytophthora megakarya TaxID=4795 RepID=A0A225V5U3_9STRA|nr:hypothetical protein PHMEG_00029153 [Phytophthora megakarya]